MAETRLEQRLMTAQEAETVRFAKECLEGKPLTLVLSILTHLLADALMVLSDDDEAQFDENLDRVIEAVKGNKMFIQAAGATKQ